MRFVDLCELAIRYWNGDPDAHRMLKARPVGSKGLSLELNGVGFYGARWCLTPDHIINCSWEVLTDAGPCQSFEDALTAFGIRSKA